VWPRASRKRSHWWWCWSSATSGGLGCAHRSIRRAAARTCRLLPPRGDGQRRARPAGSGSETPHWPALQRDTRQSSSGPGPTVVATAANRCSRPSYTDDTAGFPSGERSTPPTLDPATAYRAREVTGPYPGKRTCAGGWERDASEPRRQSRLAMAANPGNALCSPLREVMPSFVNTLRKCHSTVRGLRNSCAPISGLVRPSRARRAISSSYGVRSSRVASCRLRTVSPVVRSSWTARSANASLPISVNMSWGVRSWSRASMRRFWRRSHSP